MILEFHENKLHTKVNHYDSFTEWGKWNNHENVLSAMGKFWKLITLKINGFRVYYTKTES